MKRTVVSALLIWSVGHFAYAHDEGHGPKLSDTGKHGGLVSAVVLKADASKGEEAPLVYKSELARASDGTVRVYFYDAQMNPIDSKVFASKGSASVASKVKGKWKSQAFSIELQDGVFIGKMAKPASKPYNIDVTVQEGDKELLTAFDGLD